MENDVKKVKRFNFQVLNIKSIQDPPQPIEEYEKMFKSIHRDKITVKVPGGKNAIIRTVYEKKLNDGTKYLYGMFSKFNSIEGKDWLDLTNLQVSQFNMPPDLFPNLIETNYIFIPAAHRFALVTSPSFNIFSAEKFFQTALLSFSDKEYEVIVEQSEDIFNEIIEADTIERLTVNISFSNSDNYRDAELNMDKQLKLAKAKSFYIEATAQKNESISLESDLIAGAIGVAQSNGNATATIKKNGLRKIINTLKHPRKFLTSCNPDNPEIGIANEVLKEFRNE